MQNSQDLSKVISIIASHPEIMEQISALMSGNEKSKEEEKSEEAVSVQEKSTDNLTRDPSSERRRQLLNAMKPYLSKSRASAIETMLTVSDVLESMKGR